MNTMLHIITIAYMYVSGHFLQRVQDRKEGCYFKQCLPGNVGQRDGVLLPTGDNLCLEVQNREMEHWCRHSLPGNAGQGWSASGDTLCVLVRDREMER